MTRIKPIEVRSEIEATNAIQLATKDKTLSWKAKGLLAYMLTLKRPHYKRQWRVFIPELLDISKNKRRYILSGLKELEERGYITIYKNRADDAARRQELLIAA